jgi:RNA polymerase sigma factor (sigma-70 family)
VNAPFPSQASVFRCVAFPSEDTRWFEGEVEPHESDLRNFLRTRFPALVDIDDVVQESYVRLFRARRAGKISQVRPYLFVIARNVAFDSFRRRQISGIEGMAEVDRLSVVEDRPDAAEVVSRDQELEMLHEAIQALPARCREVFSLRKLHGLSHGEIAEKLGLSVNTIEHHVSHGLLRCRQYLAERGVTPERLKRARQETLR